MRFHYLLYPEAQQRLESSDLLKRIEETHNSENGIPYIGHTMDSEVVQAVKEMQEEGYFKTLRDEDKVPFQKRLQDAFKDKEHHTWKVHRTGNIIENPVEPEDFYLMTGWLGSCVLKPNELWDFRKFGFDSLGDFVGSFGAAVWSSHKSDFRGGYKWVTQTPNGRVLQNNISGDGNLDLRVYQTDITPDKTFDPLGSQVSYRPELDEDRGTVAACHSAEPGFLTGVLKWVHQQNIPNEMLKYNGWPLINWIGNLGHRIGASAECFRGMGGMDSPRGFFGSFYEQIPILDETFSTDRPSFDGVHVDGESYFGMYIGPNKELIFSYERKGERKRQKKPEVVFQPTEADHLLKGIFYQAANRLGRTVPQKLMAMIKYRFSGQMEKDLERFSKP